MPRVRTSGTEVRVLGVTFPIRRYGDGRVVTWYYHGSTRKRVTRAKESELRSSLEEIAVRIVNGNLDANEIGGAEARMMIAAREALAPLKLPIDLAAREYAAARALLGETPLLEAVRFFKRHAGVDLTERKTSQVVTEFLAAKSGLSADYRDQLRKDLARLSSAHGERYFSELKLADFAALIDEAGRVDKHRRRIPPGAARRNQLRNNLVTLANFARDHGYLVRERQTQAELLPKIHHVRGEIAILSPADLRLLLDLAGQLDRDWVPYIVLGAFAGIRATTLQRLEWKAVRWDEGVISVPAAKAKTKRRYLPPLLPAAIAWLRDWREERGPICPQANPRYFLQRLTRRAGWRAWPKNVLRKSFISYRLAILKNADAVALEANNSPAEIFENYREVCTAGGDSVTQALAEKYFATMPAEANNIIPLQSHLAL